MLTKIHTLNNSDDPAWGEVRRICTLTGAYGRFIEDREYAPVIRFFEEFWIGPYQRLLPGFTWVVRDENQKVLGYLTGCPDTKAFERQKRLEFFPGLLARAVLSPNIESKRFLRRWIGLERSPQSLFDAESLKQIEEEYQAHLHMNFLPEVQGRGLGKQIIEKYVESLIQMPTKRNEPLVTGIHLHCGEKPVRFYEKVGFKVLSQILFKPDVPVFLMGRSL